MSGVDKIIQKITEDAKAQSAENLEIAQAKADSLLQAGQEQAKAKKAAAMAAAKEEGQDLIKRQEAVSDLELRKQVLAMKREMLDQVFARAKEEIQEIGEEDYQRLMTRLLVECAKAQADGAITISKRDKGLLGKPDYVKEAEKQLAAEGLETKIKVDGTDESISGGFLYHAGGMQMDCTLTAVVSQKREALETGVNQILFEQES